MQKMNFSLQRVRLQPLGLLMIYNSIDGTCNDDFGLRCEPLLMTLTVRMIKYNLRCIKIVHEFIVIFITQSLVIQRICQRISAQKLWIAWERKVLISPWLVHFPYGRRWNLLIIVFLSLVIEIFHEVCYGKLWQMVSDHQSAALGIRVVRMRLDPHMLPSIGLVNMY